MKLALRLSLCVVLLVPVGVQADVTLRTVGPQRTWTDADAALIDASWLHVKFVEGSDVNLVNDVVGFEDRTLDLTAVNRALASHGAVELRRTFRGDRATLRELKHAGELRSGTVGPDLSLWYDVRVTGGVEQVVQLVNALNACPGVEIAHPSPCVESAVLRQESSVSDAAGAVGGSASRGGTPDFTALQEYLYDVPVGLDAPSAWAVTGGRGAGIKFIDVELAWTEDHEDFEPSNIFYLGGASENAQYEPHGTAVLGEVLGQHNDYGVNGFAPDVQYGRVAIAIADWPIVPQWFQEAIDHLDTGDVWLIELQTTEVLPMEYYQANYDVIWTGCWSRGIVCVEAAGNGSHDLDSPVYGGVFDRDVRDSGAIMVGAGLPYTLVAESFTNYGTRVDVQAWGSQITTTGYGDLYNGGTLQTRYTDVFGGTSGASPMVTGSALCLQGIALANQSRVLDPIELRSLLHDTGTPQAGTRLIGPRPDLGAAVDALLNSASVPESGSLARLPLVAAPNPFHERSEVRFSLSEATNGTLTVFDAQGRAVRLLQNGSFAAGPQVVGWDGRDDDGTRVASGVYYYRLRTDGSTGSAAIRLLR